MLAWCADNAGDIATRYGNVTKASVGSIQRQLLTLEDQGGDRYRLHIDADHEGWSGIILIGGQGPFPQDVVAPQVGARGLLRVRLLPAGDGWDAVAQVIVDLRYEDAPNGLRREESLVLKTSQEFRTWEVALRDQNRRGFEYRVHASFKDGRFQQGPWQSHTGEETLPIVVQAPPRHQIQIIPDRLDLAAAPLTEVGLTHLPTGRQETFVFRAKQPVVWNVDVPAGTPVRYRVQVTHFPATGDPVVLPPFEEEDPVLVLPPYQPPRPGSLTVQLVGALIDFAQTPLVTVDLRYQDEVHGIDASHAVAFSERATLSWTVEVGDLSRRFYSYQITYFVAPDQTPHTLPLAHTDKPLLVIPRWQPAP